MAKNADWSWPRKGWSWPRKGWSWPRKGWSWPRTRFESGYTWSE